MPIVTIRGQLGSGAPEIGKLIAERLCIDYIDREVIAKVAELLNARKEAVAEKELPAIGLWERIAKALGSEYALGAAYTMDGSFMSPFSGAYLPTWQIPLDDTRYLSGLESVIKELAGNQSVVIRGRGSQFILRDHPGAFHVLVVAPIEIRVKRITQSMQMDQDRAEREVAHSDNSRGEFIKRHFMADMGDPVHYDIVINTAHLSFENAASIVVNTLPLKAQG